MAKPPYLQLMIISLVAISDLQAAFAADSDLNWIAILPESVDAPQGFTGLLGEYLIGARVENQGGIGLNLEQRTVGSLMPGFLQANKNPDGSFWALRDSEELLNPYLISSDFQSMKNFQLPKGMRVDMGSSSIHSRDSTSAIVENVEFLFLFGGKSEDGSNENFSLMQFNEGVIGAVSLPGNNSYGILWQSGPFWGHKSLYGEFTEFGKITEMYHVPNNSYQMTHFNGSSVILVLNTTTTFSFIVPDLEKSITRTTMFDFGFSRPESFKFLSCSQHLILLSSGYIWVFDEDLEAKWAKTYSVQGGMVIDPNGICGEDDDQFFLSFLFSLGAYRIHDLRKAVVAFSLSDPANPQNQIEFEDIDVPKLTSTKEQPLEKASESETPKVSIESLDGSVTQEESPKFTAESKISFSAVQNDDSNEFFLSSQGQFSRLTASSRQK